MVIAPEQYGTDKCDPTEKYQCELKVDKAIRHKTKIATQVKQLYALVVGQYTDAL